VRVKSHIDVYCQGAREEISLPWIADIAARILEKEGCEAKGSLNIILTEDAAIQELNLRYLGKKEPTDVMAFPLGNGEEDVWGEVYISRQRAKEQARAYGVSFEEELARLTIHGVLHLVGYDDIDRNCQAEMRKKEDFYLDRIFHSGSPHRKSNSKRGFLCEGKM